jgi:hypothetical protein
MVVIPVEVYRIAQRPPPGGAMFHGWRKSMNPARERMRTVQCCSPSIPTKSASRVDDTLIEERHHAEY